MPTINVKQEQWPCLMAYQMHLTTESVTMTHRYRYLTQTTYFQMHCVEWNSRIIWKTIYDVFVHIVLEIICFIYKKNIWHVESNYNLQSPNNLIIIVNQFRYINNIVRWSIPMDMTIAPGFHKSNPQATIGHHEISMYSVHYNKNDWYHKVLYCMCSNI